MAAKEIRRYIYLRTDRFCKVEAVDSVPTKGDLILVAAKGSGLIEEISFDEAAMLKHQEYVIKTIEQKDRKIVVICGGDRQGALYGAYHFAEMLGVRFYLHGDVVPDSKISLKIPEVDVVGRPLFDKRGILPFHDFPEGPDWWSVDEWKTAFEQMVKMRMNFVGLHTYPKGALGPEPTVWIGLPQDCDEDGAVSVADNTSWHNTQRYAEYGCYRPQKTSEFSCGGADIFPSDNYGSPVNLEHDFPFPGDAEQSNAMFGRAGGMLNEIFSYARRSGIKTCVGTEAPLNIPEVVKARCKAVGLDPADPETVEKLYEGMFTWIGRNYPIDYYWLWGYEGQIKEDAFKNDFLLAYKAAKKINAPFKMGICGWGWIANNFPVLDEAFADDVAFSCINMSVGKEFLSPNFDKVKGREKWAIPWFEDDPAMITPQLWVGRMRKDAVDALEYECNGLMGLHWRTRVLGPNISALARAGWNQGEWSKPEKSDKPKEESKVFGGNTAVFLNNPVAGTEDDIVFQHVRYNFKGYELAVPQGSYTVVLQFCEPAYKEAGKRVFDVELQGEKVISNLDVFAKVGQFQALEHTFDNIKVDEGKLRIGFAVVTEFPCAAGIVIKGANYTRKINCGGGAYKDYQADIQSEKSPRFLPVDDFYMDWARAQFGPEASQEIADIFIKQDGHFPRPDNWNRGPGVISVSRQPFNEKKYEFVRQMEALLPQIKGDGNSERFGYWLNQFLYTEAMEKLGCMRGQLDAMMESIGAEKDADRKGDLLARAVKLRGKLARQLEIMYGYLLATLNNSSEMGTIANVEQQSMLRTKLLNVHDKTLEDLLGKSLPAKVHLRKDYQGPVRIVVPAKRSIRNSNEALNLKVIILGNERVQTARLFYRTMGSGDKYKQQNLEHQARSVYNVTLPQSEKDVEYYIEAVTKNATLVRWPVSGPRISQTVISLP